MQLLGQIPISAFDIGLRAGQREAQCLETGWGFIIQPFGHFVAGIGDPDQHASQGSQIGPDVQGC